MVSYRNSSTLLYRNKLNYLLRISKRRHYQDLIENIKNNLSKSRKIIREIINKRKVNAVQNSQFIDNGKTLKCI